MSSVSALSAAAAAPSPDGAAHRHDATSTWGRALRAIRLRHWAHFLLLPLAGRDAALPALEGAVAIGRGVAIAFCLLAYGYLLNSHADRHMDLAADKRGVALLGTGAVRTALIAFVAVALALALTGPWIVGAATVVCLASGTLYSVGPRLKTLPLVGSTLNVGNFAPLLFVGLARDAVPAALFGLTVTFTLLLLQNQLLHEAADAEEDARGAVQSTFRRLGRGGTALLAFVTGVAVAAAAPGPAAAIVSGVGFGLASPLALAAWGDRPALAARLRLAHRGLSLAYGAWLYSGLYLAG